VAFNEAQVVSDAGAGGTEVALCLRVESKRPLRWAGDNCWGRPLSGGRATCDDSNALHECVWRHDALQPPSKFMSMKTLFSKISQFPSSGQPVTVFILYIRTTGDSVHTIHQDNR
jgi:hypothetical protein